MAARKKAREGRFAIYDESTGRCYLQAVSFSTRSDAERELASLLRPYPPGSEWRYRLVVREARGCGERCESRGLTCNLMMGHRGPHQEVRRVSEQRTIVHTFPGVH